MAVAVVAVVLLRLTTGTAGAEKVPDCLDTRMEREPFDLTTPGGTPCMADGIPEITLPGGPELPGLPGSGDLGTVGSIDHWCAGSGMVTIDGWVDEENTPLGTTPHKGAAEGSDNIGYDDDVAVAGSVVAKSSLAEISIIFGPGGGTWTYTDGGSAVKSPSGTYENACGYGAFGGDGVMKSQTFNVRGTGAIPLITYHSFGSVSAPI